MRNSLISFFGTLFILSISSCQQQKRDNAVEITSIKMLLQKEASSWRSGNYKEHSECWYIQPYSRILVSLADGRTFDVPPSAMKDPKTTMGNGGKAIQSNFKFKINETDAWVSHNEVSIAKDGQKTFSYEIRMLEKVNNQWKIVGQSIHIYHPK
jgi:hypothetical protein